MSIELSGRAVFTGPEGCVLYNSYHYDSPVNYDQGWHPQSISRALNHAGVSNFSRARGGTTYQECVNISDRTIRKDWYDSELPLESYDFWKENKVELYYYSTYISSFFCKKCRIMTNPTVLACLDLDEFKRLMVHLRLSSKPLSHALKTAQSLDSCWNCDGDTFNYRSFEDWEWFRNEHIIANGGKIIDGIKSCTCMSCRG